MENDYLTVGKLKGILEGLPDETPVLYHRIEDVYFKKHGWKPELVPSEYEGDSDEYIRAFTAFKFEGKLLITAHF